ncbi:hypothetical protein GW7_16875 [Heterocephalus glaber]|uniref:Uncharacterized protein n=1 Tax=Heterocephalus glaber TaxID=10181 RepID=G5BI70_HETGA|nr:hypothetical protein GW7_16875 [Heterocephalus glaber]
MLPGQALLSPATCAEALRTLPRHGTIWPLDGAIAREARSCPAPVALHPRRPVEGPVEAGALSTHLIHGIQVAGLPVGADGSRIQAASTWCLPPGENLRADAPASVWASHVAQSNPIAPTSLIIDPYLT